MGGGTSRPAFNPADFTVKPDLAFASYPADYVQKLAKEQADAIKKATEVKKSAPLIDWSKINFWKLGVILVILIGLALALILLYDVIARAVGWRTLILSGNTTPSSSSPPGPSFNPDNVLYIDSATYGTTKSSQDVSAKLKSMRTSPDFSSIPSFKVDPTNLGLSSDPDSTSSNTLSVTYHFGQGSGSNKTVTASEGDPFGISPPTPSSPSKLASSSSLKATVQPPPPLLRSMFSRWVGPTSGGSSLQSSIQDATSSSTIPSASAPLSVGSDGSYGMQWWMFIKDWNYGYGQQKTVVKRADPSSTAITNPNISLHPTDNSLVVTVSVFPATEGGASKSSPAPYGHSSATDDVFVCEVPNVPLQTWFSVATTVFGRNLDIYIDGKLVKSCFLPGVPKPAMGDVQLTPGGGFSGYVCEFTHYDRMLTPDDAIAFYNAGTNCQSATQPSAVSQATGYSVKFGVYDATGKEVKEYAF